MEQNIKILVVYYSFEGNTKFIADAIAAEIKADLLELKPVTDIGTTGFMKYFWGGRQVVRKMKPELASFNKDPQNYEMLFIGTPVWAFTFTPALRSFFDKVKLNNKKIALFCCHGGTPAKTIENMKRELAGNDILGEMCFIEPKSNDSVNNSMKAREWASNIVKRLVP